MDIVAESLSAKILKSREVLVNGKDIMDYIRSKLSTAVEFNGVYDSLKAAEAAGANFNGSIVIVSSKEYIWYDKDRKWHEIGDETIAGQLAEDVKILSGNVSYIGSISADLSCQYKLTANAGSMAYKNASDYLSSVPETYKTYQSTLSSLSIDGYALTSLIPTYKDISTNIHLSGYALSNDVSSKTALHQLFSDAKAYSDGISANVDNLSTYLAYALLTSESTTEGMAGGFDRAGIRRIVFMPSYLGLSSNDDLTSIVLKTKDTSASLLPILTGNSYGYVRVRKYSGLNDDGELVGLSDKFHWPDTITTNVEIPFSEKIKFEEPNALYYFEFLSGTSTTINENLLTAFGVSLYLVNSNDPLLPTLSSHYYAMNWNWQANPLTNVIQPRWRPYLSANYRHMYSMAEVEGKVEEKFNELIGSSSDLSSASTINGAKKYANDLVGSLNVEDSQTSGQFVVAVSLVNGKLSATKAALTIPEGLSSYVDTKNLLSNDGYALSNDVSSKIDLENKFNEKLDATVGAKPFSELSTYSLYEHVSHNGLIWECISAITNAGPWNDANWQTTDMTSPDATLDVTSDDRLRVVSADGSVIWQQGYNISYDQYNAITSDISALSVLIISANNTLESLMNDPL